MPLKFDHFRLEKESFAENICVLRITAEIHYEFKYFIEFLSLYTKIACLGKNMNQ